MEYNRFAFFFSSPVGYGIGTFILVTLEIGLLVIYFVLVKNPNDPVHIKTKWNIAIGTIFVSYFVITKITPSLPKSYFPHIFLVFAYLALFIVLPLRIIKQNSEMEMHCKHKISRLNPFSKSSSTYTINC